MGDDSDQLRKITHSDIDQRMHKAKTKSSPGEDSIKYNLIKELPLKVKTILANIMDLCLNIGYFPKIWKSAIGVMIPKKDKDSKQAKNYRPISLLSCMGKT